MSNSGYIIIFSTFVVSSYQQCFYTDSCYTLYDNGMTYRGNISTTQHGKSCVDWDKHSYDVTPEKYPYDGLNKNGCRNPRGSGQQPWCYTSANKTENYWGYCSIATCDQCLVKGIRMKEGDIFHNGCSQCICTSIGLRCLTCPKYSDSGELSYSCYPKQAPDGRYPACCKRVVCNNKDRSDQEWNFDEYMAYMKNVLDN